MPLRKFRAAMSRRLDDARDAAQRNIPAAQLRDQIAPQNLGPRGNTGAGYTPAAHAVSHEDGGGDALDLGSIAGELTDTQHGGRSGGTLHAVATGSVAGFQSAADKAKEDLYPAISALTPGDVLTALTSATVGFAPPVSGSGTVTSVALTAPAELSVSGSPITGAGTLALIWANATANTVLAGPTTGSPGTPASRALVAADIPSLDWAKITTGLPTTLSGYGITDAYTKTAADARYAPIAVPWASITGTPTTIAGYGITDAFTQTLADARYRPIAYVPAFADLTSKPTTLAGYGITDALNSATTRTANTVYAGPATGSPAAPTFRALVAADLPLLAPIVGVAAPLFYNSFFLALDIADASTSVRGTMSAADKTKLDGIASGATANAGTVTSVSLVLPSLFSVIGSPVSSSGTLTGAFANQSANTVLAGPTTGSPGTPTIRALVAADLPAISLTAGVSGILSSPNGGTGVNNTGNLAWPSGGGTAALISSGTYSPTYTGLSTAGTTTYTTQLGTWTRIGNVVYVWGRVVWTAASGTGGALISLPTAPVFTRVTRFAVTVYPVNITFANGSVTGTLDSTTGSTQFVMNSPATNAAGALVAVEAAGDLSFSAEYEVA